MKNDGTGMRNKRTKEMKKEKMIERKGGGERESIKKKQGK